MTATLVEYFALITPMRSLAMRMCACWPGWTPSNDTTPNGDVPAGAARFGKGGMAPLVLQRGERHIRIVVRETDRVCLCFDVRVVAVDQRLDAGLLGDVEDAVVARIVRATAEHRLAEDRAGLLRPAANGSRRDTEGSRARRRSRRRRSWDRARPARPATWVAAACTAGLAAIRPCLEEQRSARDLHNTDQHTLGIGRARGELIDHLRIVRDERRRRVSR